MQLGTRVGAGPGRKSGPHVSSKNDSTASIRSLERPLTAHCCLCSRRREAASVVQGFGHRPVDDLSASADGRCPKAFREGTRGGRGWRSAILWGFAGAASWVGAALAVVMGDGPTIGVGILSPRRPLTGCFWHDRGCRTRPGRPRSIVLRCRRRGFPGGGWCDEAVTGVMASRS